jgi:molybdate transport system substrate-binding protein
VADLGPPAVALAMPNPEFEGVARQIRASLDIHHRQMPFFLMRHLVEAGVTWKSEAIFQEEIGNPIGHVDIPAELNTLANYSAAVVADAPHPAAARVWLDFVGSDGAFKILEHYGFRRFAPTPR